VAMVRINVRVASICEYVTTSDVPSNSSMLLARKRNKNKMLQTTWVGHTSKKKQ